MITDTPPPEAPAPVAAPRRRSAWWALPGWVAVVVVLGALAYGFVPVTNPGVQRCGAPITFVLDAKLDSYPDAAGRLQQPDGSIPTLTKAELDRAFHHQCSKRAAHRMVRVAIAALSGVALGLIVLFASLVSWWRAAPPLRPVPTPTVDGPPLA